MPTLFLHRRRIGPCEVLVALLATFVLPALAVAQAQREARSELVAPSDLPLTRVVLFSSGVAYHERTGQVAGDRTVEFLFRESDVNDLLKSMVVQDLDGGRVAGVRYASQDPPEKTLGSFSIDLSRNPGIAAILNQARGQDIEAFSPERVAGRVVGVEERAERDGKTDLFVNLLTPEGMRSVRLSLVTHFRFTDARLDAEMHEALAIVAASRDHDRKRVAVTFSGEGRRRVRIGYLLASPVWKTSYRLVLGPEGQARPGAPPHYLQGWAIVENTGDEPWTDVRVSLVSGRPISFVMDLYRPLYAQRPVVQQETFAALKPQRYDDDLRSESAAAPRPAPPAPAAASAPGRAKSGAAAGVRGAESAGDLAWAEEAQATGAEVGSFFEYSVDRPVSIARHESAMLPIVSGGVEGSRVSIFDQGVLSNHPLLGFRLRNTTGLDLAAGPITLFDGGVYAGDARIDDLPAGAERLLSYAVDLETEVAVQDRAPAESLVSVRLLKGSLVATRLQRRDKTYTIKNSSGRPREILIEHPLEPGWDLVQPESPAERTRSAYRFAVTAAPSAVATLSVAERRTVSQTVLLTSLPDDTIAFYIQAREVSDKVKEALRSIAARKTTLNETVAARQDEERKQQQITADQGRIRENMSRLDREAALYKRYVAQLDAQENELAGLRARTDALRQREADQRKALDDAIRSLDVD
jgi:hypothetical protein